MSKIESIDDHIALICKCGSANFAVLKSGKIECHSCGKVRDLPRQEYPLFKLKWEGWGIDINRQGKFQLCFGDQDQCAVVGGQYETYRECLEEIEKECKLINEFSKLNA